MDDDERWFEAALKGPPASDSDDDPHAGTVATSDEAAPEAGRSQPVGDSGGASVTAPLSDPATAEKLPGDGMPSGAIAADDESRQTPAEGILGEETLSGPKPQHGALDDDLPSDDVAAGDVAADRTTAASPSASASGPAEPSEGDAAPGGAVAASATPSSAPTHDAEWAQAIGEAVAQLPTLDAAPAAEAPAAQAPADDIAANGNGTPAARALPRTVAIANQKGGVGKTTTAVNLGAGLAELGYRVLVVDLDPQGNATTGLGINARSLSCSVYDVLLSDTPLDDCIEPTAVRNLFVAPATIDLAGAEIELVSSFSRELKLRRALDQLGDDYDFTLIDCPPSLGLLTVNGLAAATEVLVPIQCEYYALEGLGQLLRNVQLVQNNLNPRLELSAIVLTMFDARTRLADQVASEVRAHFGPKVCRNIIPRTVRLSEAPSFGQPIIVFDSSSRGALAYRELAKEVSGGTPQRIG